ncbi:MAG: DNA-binding protein [Acidimicrobiia bacterium]|nr:DNA-binding protein [Acidimicrobiia bacterium]
MIETVVKTAGRNSEVEDLPPSLLRPAEVAEVLNVSVSQVYTLMRTGELAALKIGRKGVWRVSRETLEAYIAQLEADARARTK